MSDSVFRLPYSSYDQLTKIIMAYGTFAQNASNSDVSKAIDIHETTISANNAFLMEIGVLEGKGPKSLTKSGRDLARALEHEMQGEIHRNWREIVAGNDFMQKVLSAVRIRKGMERSALQAHIAYSAGQSRSESVLRGAGAVIDILRAAELLKDDDGKLVVGEIIQRPSDGIETRDDQIETPSFGNGSAGKFSVASPHAGQSEASTPVVAIQIQIQCTVSEIEQLGPKLRKMLRELTEPGPQPEAQSIELSPETDGLDS
jgi:hypothetical protein